MSTLSSAIKRLPWRRCGPSAESSAMPPLATGGRTCWAAPESAPGENEAKERTVIGRGKLRGGKVPAREGRVSGAEVAKGESPNPITGHSGVGGGWVKRVAGAG